MRRAAVAAAITALLVTTACSEPPHEEINRAQGAIDAARAAGAEQYAAEPFKAAVNAMQQTHDAVRQRDYRLALSLAIDANERAIEAATQAANGKARARADADAALRRAADALQRFEQRLTAAEAARLPARELQAPRRARTDAQRILQEARTAFGSGDYPAVVAATKGLAEKMASETTALDGAIEARTARPARRRR
jgi:hypothetical protein